MMTFRVFCSALNIGFLAYFLNCSALFAMSTCSPLSAFSTSPFSALNVDLLAYFAGLNAGRFAFVHHELIHAVPVILFFSDFDPVGIYTAVWLLPVGLKCCFDAFGRLFFLLPGKTVVVCLFVVCLSLRI